MGNTPIVDMFATEYSLTNSHQSLNSFKLQVPWLYFLQCSDHFRHVGCDRSVRVLDYFEEMGGSSLRGASSKL